MFGLLNLNKPVGLSSAAVLGRIKHLVKPAKIGHAGTLDPIASGVLIACLGPATRLVEYVQRMPKRYRGVFLLGRSSESEDIEREITELIDPPIPTLDEIQHAAAAMIGEIQQRPPIFSAIKVAGRRAYELARKGRDVELQSRAITVHKLWIESYDYPELTLQIACSSGTYVRSIGRDLAESLGTAAVMSALQRTAIGPFHVADACDPRTLNAETLPSRILSPRAALDSLPTLALSDVEVELVIHGLPFGSPFGTNDSAQLAAIDAQGELVSILYARREGQLWPLLNFRKAGA